VSVGVEVESMKEWQEEEVSIASSLMAAPGSIVLGAVLVNMAVCDV
jgi:hypothetical protein